MSSGRHFLLATGFIGGLWLSQSPTASAIFKNSLAFHRESAATLGVLAHKQEIDLPASTATGMIEPLPEVSISKEALAVRGERLFELEQHPHTGKISVPSSEQDPDNGLLLNGEHSLSKELEEIRETLSSTRGMSSTLESQILSTLTEDPSLSHTPGHFDGSANFVVDRAIPFSLLHKVLYTAGQEQFSQFSFIVENSTLGLVSITSRAPAIGMPPPSDAEMRRSPLGLVLVLDTDGIEINGSYVVRQTLDSSARSFPCESSGGSGCSSPRDYDWQGLATSLKKLKAVRPDEQRVILSVGAEVPWEIAVAALDVARDGAGLVELDPQWRSRASKSLGDSEPLSLFPSAVLAGGN